MMHALRQSACSMASRNFGPPIATSAAFPTLRSSTRSFRKWQAGLRPLHDRRHRRQDRLDITAGAQTENGAAVVEQVELDIAAAAHELFLALGLGPRRCKISLYQHRIDLAQRAADLLRKGEVGLPIARVVPVVKDSADAARLVAVFEIEIVVAPFLVFLVGADAVMRLAG